MMSLGFVAVLVATWLYLVCAWLEINGWIIMHDATLRGIERASRSVKERDV
jgi:hypothetical protein